MRVSRWTVGVALATWVAAASASAEPLAVQSGLWEVAAEGDAGGALSALPGGLADQLAKLSPSQQAKIQQYLSEAGGMRFSRRICVTPALLQQALTGGGLPHHCSRSVVSGSATALEIQGSCTGKHGASGTLRLTVADPHTVNGTVDGQVTIKEGTTIAVHGTLQGRWLAADCGGVAPPVQ